MADRSGTNESALWRAFPNATAGSILRCSPSGTEDSTSGSPSNDDSAVHRHPLRRAWWMKHLSLLAVLQAACLAVGLAIFHQLQNASGAPQVAAASIGNVSSPVLSSFIWIASVQGALGYLVFSRIYRVSCEQQKQSEASVEEHRQALDRTRDAVILGLSQLAESRDGDTQGHLDRVGIYAEKLARTAAQRPEFAGQISKGLIARIRPSAALHDIGKVGIEDSILQKPGRLTDKERRRMQAHTRISGECLFQIQECLGDSNFLTLAHEIAVFHHERWDGSGYPSRLAGNAIPLSARIVAIADVYDALSARRVYKDAYAHERCVEIILSESGQHFDPRLVDAFLEIESEFAQIAASCPDPPTDCKPAGNTATDFDDDDVVADDIVSDNELCQLDAVLTDVDDRLEASVG